MYLAQSTSGQEEGGPGRSTIWVAPLTVLFAVWLWLAFSSGGNLPAQWLPIALTLGLFGLVVATAVAYPRRPRQLSLVVLGLFSVYALWVTSSVLWAESTSRAWLEAERTFFYLLLFALALVFLTEKKARRAFRYLLLGAATLLLGLCIGKLWSADNVASLFYVHRLSYPVSYPNSAAALFLVGFWPLIWLAAGSTERTPLRGLALGLATGLLGLGVMTQSRGAIWSLAISLLVMFLVSPCRLRTLLYLLVPGLLLVYEFPILNRYWQGNPAPADGGPAARALLVASVTAAFIGLILALLENWVRVSRKMKAVFGTVVLLGALIAAGYGLTDAAASHGGLTAWMQTTWHQFTSTQTSADFSPDDSSSTRFSLVNANGRIEIWRVAWQEFERHPILGVGADNFVFEYNLLRQSESSKPQQPHSLFLQTFAETGAVGGTLFVLSILFAAGALLLPRIVAGWRGARGSWLKPTKPRGPTWCQEAWGCSSLDYGWNMALFAALSYWLIHSSVEWLWQMAAVTVPAFMLLAAGLAEVDATGETTWPRLAGLLHVNVPERLPVLAQEQDEAAGPPNRRARSERVKRKGRHSSGFLNPPGLLSPLFRILLAALSLIVLIGGGLPYLSLAVQRSALAAAEERPAQAVERAGSARWLFPGDPRPYLTQASICEEKARQTLESLAPKATTVLDSMASAVAACEQALSVEPADWSIAYRAGVDLLNLNLAHLNAAGLSPNLNYQDLWPKIPGLIDPSPLGLATDHIISPTEVTGAPFVVPATYQARVTELRSMPSAGLASLARTYLLYAAEKNPLARQVGEALMLVEALEAQESYAP